MMERPDAECSPHPRRPLLAMAAASQAVAQDDTDPKIARVDIDASFDSASRKLSGSATIAFTALAGDPLDTQALKIVIGIRVEFAD